MLAYIFYEDFELSELVPISVLNTSPDNRTQGHMFKKFLNHQILRLLRKTSS